jgi:hypothetical protein
MKDRTDMNSYRILLWKRGGMVKCLEQNELSFEFFEEDFDFVLYLKFPYAKVINLLNLYTLRYSLEQIYQEQEDTFIILPLRWAPPAFQSSIQEGVYSFISPFQPFKQLIAAINNTQLKSSTLLFTLLDKIIQGNTLITKVLVRQIPLKKTAHCTGTYCDVVIPHRGDTEYLKSVLNFLEPLSKINVCVGIDQELGEEILDLKSKHTKASFYHFEPSPLGPYVIRNRLIKETKSDIIFFQDSDDVPCADRFLRITDYMQKTGCQLCGSHELRVDYLDQTVKAVRFPIDVKKAMEIQPNGHQLFHPASAITRDAFQICNNLSADRTFGYDTQFLLRSFFLLDKIKNIDEFLYIRRLHADSLTTAPATRMNSPLRRFSLMLWYQDFTLLQKGKLQLKDSTLIYRPAKIPYTTKLL